MKRIAFLIVVVSFSTFSLASESVWAQNFPTTRHASFQSQSSITIPEAATTPLPPIQPLAGNDAQSVISAVNSGATPSFGQIPEPQIFRPPTQFPDFSKAAPPAYSQPTNSAPVNSQPMFTQPANSQLASTQPQQQNFQQQNFQQQNFQQQNFQQQNFQQPQQNFSQQNFQQQNFQQQNFQQPQQNFQQPQQNFSQQNFPQQNFTQQQQIPALSQQVPAGQSQSAGCQSCGCADGNCQDFVINESQFSPNEGTGRHRHRAGLVGRVKQNKQARREFRQATSDHPLPQRSSKKSGRARSTLAGSGLLFGRNNGNNVGFSSNDDGQFLFSDDADADVLAGFDATYSRRYLNGRGFEFRYFGLFPGEQSTEIGDNATSLLSGLDQIGTSISGTGPAAFLTGPSANDFFNAADTHVLTRQSDFNNIEANILENTAPRFGAASTELLLGFRYFQFGETLLFQGVDIPQGNPSFASPERVDYFSTVENELLGIQIGARSDYHIRQRLGIHFGFKVGAFNNNVQVRQRVNYELEGGDIITPRAAGGTLSGEQFDVGAEENVSSLLGELDFSVTYQVSHRSRFRIGYRAIGITDIAFASDQIGDNFNDATALRTPDTRGDLTLQGGYVGFERAY